MCSAIGAIGEGVLTNRIRLCILDMSVLTIAMHDTWSINSTSKVVYFEVQNEKL